MVLAVVVMVIALAAGSVVFLGDRLIAPPISVPEAKSHLQSTEPPKKQAVPEDDASLPGPVTMQKDAHAPRKDTDKVEPSKPGDMGLKPSDKHPADAAAVKVKQPAPPKPAASPKPAAPKAEPAKTPANTPAGSTEMQILAEAGIAVKNGDYDKAFRLYEDAIRTNPKNAKAYQDLAVLQRQLGMRDEEVGTYQRWMQAMPDDPMSRYFLAEAYSRNEEFETAKEWLDQFVVLSKGDPRSFPMASSLYQRMGIPDAEQYMLETWAQNDPKNPSAQIMLGDYYQRAGDLQRAEQAFRQVVNLKPNDPSALSQLGNLYQQMGRHEEAIQQYQQALQQKPDDSVLLSRMASAYRDMGDVESARAIYEQIIASKPGTPDAELAAHNLERLEMTQQ